MWLSGSKGETRSNGLGQSKMCHVCRMNGCLESGSGMGDTCNGKIACMAVWGKGVLCPFPCGGFEAARLCLMDRQDIHDRHLPLSVPVSKSHDTKTHRN